MFESDRIQRNNTINALFINDIDQNSAPWGA